MIYPEECALLLTVDGVFLYLNRGWIVFIQTLFYWFYQLGFLPDLYNTWSSG